MSKSPYIVTYRNYGVSCEYCFYPRVIRIVFSYILHVNDLIYDVLFSYDDLPITLSRGFILHHHLPIGTYECSAYNQFETRYSRTWIYQLSGYLP